jgi:hypothetical protein
MAAKAKKLDTLRKEVESEKVKYSLNIGRLVIDPKDDVIVQLANGRHGTVHNQGLVVERDGPQHSDGFTGEFDPKIPAHAEYIRRVDEFIEANPHIVTNPKIQLRKWSGNKIPPDGAWDELSVEQIRGLMALPGKDLKAAMRYELSKGEDARDEVLDVLEELYSSVDMSNVDDADEVVL